MHIFYSPQEFYSQYDDGRAYRILAHEPPQQEGGFVYNTARVYLTVTENLASLINVCHHNRLPEPVQLAEEFLQALPQHPRPLAEYVACPTRCDDHPLRICLFNGGGGGLGDGILFAPALKILAQFVRQQSGREVLLDVYSMLPARTGVVLRGIDGVKVRALPMSVEDFMTCDYWADFSGLIQDPEFQTSHFTDFVLKKMGFTPEAIPPAAKEPFLFLPPPAPEVDDALNAARNRAEGRLLVAVMFSCTLTRTLPEKTTAELILRLSGIYQPVLLLPPEIDSATFLTQFNLEGKVIDLSPVSTDFSRYMNLLAGMDAIVTVDTSAVHIGAALRKPTVAVFNSINKEYRITYSPTVHGIQMSYRGKNCQAPCGLSKSCAFVEGTLANGRPVRLEFGYACDEALDKGKILASIIAELQHMNFGGDFNSQLHEIHKKYLTVFASVAAPCWEALSLDQILSELAVLCRSEAQSDREG